MDDVFKALADPNRRKLLDRLFKRDGQTLGELCERVDMTRFGVMKHLRVLEEAGLLVTRRQGREKLHYLNPMPIRLVHDRWVSKYRAPFAAALSDLKSRLETDMPRRRCTWCSSAPAPRSSGRPSPTARSARSTSSARPSTPTSSAARSGTRRAPPVRATSKGP